MLDSLGLPEIYFFKLVEGSGNPVHAASGLIEDTTLLKKPSFEVVKAFNQCGTVGISQHKTQTLKVYPNPANDRITIRFNSNTKAKQQLTIYDAKGRVVYAKKIEQTSETTLSTSNFNPGIHFITVQSNGQVIATGKCAIQ